MARVINDTCISCGTCAASCPVEAISQLLMIPASAAALALLPAPSKLSLRATLSTRSTQMLASIAVLARVHVLSALSARLN